MKQLFDELSIECSPDYNEKIQHQFFVENFIFKQTVSFSCIFNLWLCPYVFPVMKSLC